jgi:hypothetical protein
MREQTGRDRVAHSCHSRASVLSGARGIPDSGPLARQPRASRPGEAGQVPNVALQLVRPCEKRAPRVRSVERGADPLALFARFGDLKGRREIRAR